MMDEQDPPLPLDRARGTPPELQRALRALGRDAPSRTSLTRVAQALGPLLDAAPSVVVPAKLTLGKVALLRWLALGAVALGGAALHGSTLWKSPPPAPSGSPVAAPAPASTPPREVLAAEPTPAPVAAPVIAPDVAQAPALPAPVPEPTPHGARRSRSASRRALRAEATRGSDALGAQAGVQTAPSEPAAARAELAHEEVAQREVTQRAQPEPAPPPEPPRRQAQEARQPDEFSLLYEARQKLSREPAAALALLTAHVQRFRDGQLAPEREVLAVEALRALGRHRDAEHRLEAFRARFPGSIHLRRLQAPTE